jgi:preprotein translocase subunit YajC
VKAVTISGDTATIVRVDGTSETMAIATNDGGTFQKFIVEYNTTQPPNRQIDLRLQSDQSAFELIGPVLLALAPLLLLVLLVLFLVMQVARRADRR